MAKVGEISTPTDVTIAGGGTTILNGPRAPLSTDGATGNYWHDTVGKTLYGPRPAVAVSTDEMAINPATAPQIPNGGPANYRFGLRVQFTTAGTVTALRFYRSTGSTVTSRNLYLYRAGVQVATVASSGESGSGWKSILLTTPIAVDTGVEYISAYDTGNSNFAETDNPNVTQVPSYSTNITIAGTCYMSPPAFPSNNVAYNYHADLVFNKAGGASFWPLALKSA